MSFRVTESEERLRLKSWQEEVNYRRAVAGLRGLTADESGAKHRVAECERSFWLEVSQVGIALKRPNSSCANRASDSLIRLKHQQQLVARAKARHRRAAEQCNEQLMQVQRYDRVREKAAEALTVSVRNRLSRLQSRIDDEVCESAPLQTLCLGNQHGSSALNLDGGIERSGVCASLHRAGLAERGGVFLTPTEVQSAESRAITAGFRLQIDCILTPGVSAVLSCSSSQGRGVSAVIESSSAALVNKIHSERFAIAAALRARGFSIGNITTKRSDDSQSQTLKGALRKPRDRAQEGDEDVIA